MEGIRGDILFNESTVSHTTWRAGGKVKRFFRPADLSDLQSFFAQIEPDESLLWIGLGSNLLVRDGGFDGTAIATYRGLSDMTLLDNGNVRAQAGVACNKLARFSAKADRVGGAFFAGIPGSVGGALAMNAGAFGGETWDSVVEVTTIDRSGALRQRPPTDYSVAYRHVEGPESEFFVEAEFAFESGNGEQGMQAIRDLLAKRNATQPAGQPSCGSVFRNPDGGFAAQLIEASGLKNHAVGDARVSRKHANFIINEGNCSAADIETLMSEVQQTVLRDHGVELVPEVHIVGDRT